MKKSFGLIFAVLLLFFCSCSPYDPTPYIPREYGDAFLCDGSFTLAGQEKASGEKGSGPAPKFSPPPIVYGRKIPFIPSATGKGKPFLWSPFP